jgi:hypothetical protein
MRRLIVVSNCSINGNSCLHFIIHKSSNSIIHIAFFSSITSAIRKGQTLPRPSNTSLESQNRTLSDKLPVDDVGSLGRRTGCYSSGDSPFNSLLV